MSSEIDAALAQLAAGKVVAAATESFFGFLADIGNPLAVEALFALEPRGADKGVPTICYRALPGPRSSQDRSPPWPRPSLIVGAFS